MVMVPPSGSELNGIADQVVDDFFQAEADRRKPADRTLYCFDDRFASFDWRAVAVFRSSRAIASDALNSS